MSQLFKCRRGHRFTNIMIIILKISGMYLNQLVNIILSLRIKLKVKLIKNLWDHTHNESASHLMAWAVRWFLFSWYFTVSFIIQSLSLSCLPQVKRWPISGPLALLALASLVRLSVGCWAYGSSRPWGSAHAPPIKGVRADFSRSHDRSHYQSRLAASRLNSRR